MGWEESDGIAKSIIRNSSFGGTIIPLGRLEDDSTFIKSRSPPNRNEIGEKIRESEMRVAKFFYTTEISNDG